MTPEPPDQKNQIILAVIGVVGTLGVALIGNWANIFPRPNPPVVPNPSPVKESSSSPSLAIFQPNIFLDLAQSRIKNDIAQFDISGTLLNHVSSSDARIYIIIFEDNGWWIQNDTTKNEDWQVDNCWIRQSQAVQGNKVKFRAVIAKQNVVDKYKADRKQQEKGYLVSEDAEEIKPLAQSKIVEVTIRTIK